MFFNIQATTPSTTTTAPVSETEAALYQVFSDIFNRGDLETTKIAFKKQLKKLELNTAEADSLLDALSSVANVIVPNPTEEEKHIIEKTVLNFVQTGVSYVRSEPGLETHETDPDLIFDDNFLDFSNFYLKLKYDADYLVLNPEGAYDYFTNILDDYAKFHMVMADASKKAQAKKASTCE